MKNLDKINDKDIKKVKELIDYIKQLEIEFNKTSFIEDNISNILGIVQYEDNYIGEIHYDNNELPQIIKDSFKRTAEFIKVEMKLLREALCNYDDKNDIYNIKPEVELEIKSKYELRKKPILRRKFTY